MTNQMIVAPEQHQLTINEMGNVFVKSGFFADTRDQAQAIVKILAGQELGISPIASMTGVYIVKGKPSLGANLIAGCVKRSGRYNYRVVEHTDAVCRIEFYEKDFDGVKFVKVGESKFTIEDAKRAGTQNLDRFPRNMLFARAMSNGAKWYCADIFAGGVYTPDELGAVVQYSDNGEIEKVIEGEFKPEPQPEPEILPGDLWHGFPGVKVEDMPLEMALTATNHQGKSYGEIDNTTLQNMAAQIAKLLKTGKKKDGPVTDEERETYNFKLSAIRAILLDRESK